MEHEIIRDHATKLSRGFGFIVFDSEKTVDNLLTNGNMIDMAGTQVSSIWLRRFIHVNQDHGLLYNEATACFNSKGNFVNLFCGYFLLSFNVKLCYDVGAMMLDYWYKWAYNRLILKQG